MFPANDLPTCLRHSTDPEELATAIKAGLLWVAADERDRPHGFIACKAMAGALHILEMDVAPASGRKGIGTALLLHAVAHSKRMPYVAAITLTTFRHLPWNAPFYAKNGFRIIAGGHGFEHLELALSQEASRGLRNRVAMARNASQ